MKQKILTLLNQLNHGLVERENTLKTALLTVLAGENIVLIGPPGTGKSLMARRIAESFNHNDNSYFEYLLTKFSTPEEIFGPLSISELKQDRFKRNTAGYLPAVKMAFLDEIFKASSSILNALLTILNERIYHNGAEPQRVPLRALIAASNELPTDQEELSALYDRFLVRSFVGYVSHDNLPRLFEKVGAMPAISERTQLTDAEVDSIQRTATSVTIPTNIVDAMQRIWIQHQETFKEDRRERLSDRRLKKVIQLLRVSAATNGRSQVDLSDVFLLKDCLWNHQDNAMKVRDLILNILQTFSRPVPQSGDTIEPTLSQASAKPKTVVKGYKGSGTAQDPLVIQTVDELMDLGRPDVGQKGYYFRQTANIDCSALSHWTDIPFQGHYDGGGYTIQNKTVFNLFSNIQTQSSITNIKLNNLNLADSAEGSHITHCVSDVNLISKTATNCTIAACQAGASLIGNTATKCTITTCQSVRSLIYGEANNCTISDCLAVINLQGAENQKRGGIACNLIHGSVIERCFVTGRVQYQGGGYFYFSGIASICDASTIRQCATGRLDQNTTDLRVFRMLQETGNACTLEKNASIDSNPCTTYDFTDDRNGPEGQTVAAALFKQRYFENTLGWDFDTVWRWDDKEDRPALRSVGSGRSPQYAQATAPEADMTDLLTQQMRANIWL